MSIKQLLDTYPRVRQPLPASQAHHFEEAYLANREGRGFFNWLSQASEGWMHRAVARTAQDGSVLELGAGTLNHLPYESREPGSTYDIVEPRNFLYENSTEKKNVSTIYRDAFEIDPACRYSRIISIATLEHVLDLPRLVALSGLLLAEGGVFSNAIPSEGGMLWGLSWRLTTGLAYKVKTGHSYRNIMRHEHVSSCEEIIAIVRHFFRQVEVRRFPGPGPHASIYSVVNARNPDTITCESLLAPASRQKSRHQT